MNPNRSEQATDGGQRWQHCLACGRGLRAEQPEYSGPYCPDCTETGANQP